MRRVFAVGDIHGCVDELVVLLDRLAPTSTDRIIFLGDYVDRGPAARRVVDRLLALQRQELSCVFLKGNHEDMFLAFLGEEGRYGDAFLRNGGGATLSSYGLDDLSGPEAAHRLPPDHLDFFRRLQILHREPGFLFVHAGIRPFVPLELQDEQDLFWIRDEFTAQPHDLGSTVVFGHTPYREILLDLPYKIGLDTGLVYRNKLSCLDVEGKILYQVSRGARTVKETGLAHLFGA